MIRQFFCLHIQGIDSSFLRAHPDEAVFLHTQAGDRERRKKLSTFSLGRQLIKPFIQCSNP
jgi:hypothetical protein